MFFYIKLVGDEPIIVESKKEINFTQNIDVEPDNLYFIVTVQTQQGMGTMPVPASDNGLDHSIITIAPMKISMYAKLEEGNSLVKVVKQVKSQKSGIITPERPGIIMP